MGKYWKSVFGRAWSDTTALFPFASSPLHAWVIIFVYLVAAAILTFIAGRAQLMEEVNVIISFVAASAVIFGAIFLMNFIAAPARMDRDLKSESTVKDRIIEKLKEGVEGYLSIQEVPGSELREGTAAMETYPDDIDLVGNYPDQFECYFVVRIIVKNENIKKPLRFVRVILDRINQSKTDITLTDEGEDSLLRSFAPGEERYYVVAESNESPEEKATEFRVSGTGTAESAKQRVRVSALSIDSPKQSQWFEIYIGADSTLQIKKLDHLMEEAKYEEAKYDVAR